MNLIAIQFMKHYPTQQSDQRPASFWKLCVLLLLLNSLVFIGWGDFRQATISGHSGLDAKFNQVSIANHRDHFRSLLDIKNPPTPSGSDGDSEQHSLVRSAVLTLPVVALIHTADLHYLTFFIIDDIKYHLPFTIYPRASTPITLSY